jgi:phospholipid/cholesterol/gamma-HCH transport system substrate-binding protein
METRAPFLIVGTFVLAAIVAVFGFVYWLHNTGGLGPRNTYHVQFDGPVPGLLVGAAVLFNGIRVGEVTELGLASDNPRRVNATIAVAVATPVRPDSKVGLDFQGLTGVPVVALEGGTQVSAPEVMPVLVAEPGAGRSMTQAARDALGRVDTVLADNAQPLQDTIANLKTFSDGLAKNTSRIDSILAGVERMTGGGAPPPPKTVFDLRPPQSFALPNLVLKHQVVIPEPTAELMFDTQKLLVVPTGKDYPGFADVQWADNIPKMLQAKLLQSFENFDIAHAPLRAVEGIDANFQLLIDIRNFSVSAEPDATAEIAFSARLVDKEGKIVASRLFSERRPLEALTPAAAAAALNAAFGSAATSLIGWTAAAI